MAMSDDGVRPNVEVADEADAAASLADGDGEGAAIAALAELPKPLLCMLDEGG